MALLIPAVHGASKVYVEGTPEFRTLTLETWQGLPRLGFPDTKGLSGPVFGGRELNMALQKDKPLAAQIGATLERHNYSLGLLATLDYMRVNADCYTGMDKYEARVESCSGKLLQHQAQLTPWTTYIKNLALSLEPIAHGKLFCQNDEGRPTCSATSIDNLYVKDAKGRSIRLDEFQRRDFFKTLMNTHRANFDKLWRSSRLPEEAWWVEVVQLSEYDFDKEHYVFNVVPPQILVNRQIPPPPPALSTGRRKPGGGLSSRAFALTSEFKPTSDFEKSLQSASRPIQVMLPMSPQDARALGQSTPGRKLFAVTKIRFLPREKPGAWDPASGALKLDYHYAANTVALYRDSSLTQKVAELPINRRVVAQDEDKSGSSDDAWTDGYAIFDGRAYAFLRLQQGDLPAEQLQPMTNSVVQGERKIWQDLEQRIARLNQIKKMYEQNAAPLNQGQQQTAETRIREAEDATRLSHFSWRAMSAQQKEIFYAYMLENSSATNTWPQGFARVPWGINAATIFEKDRFSTDPTLAHLPATNEEQAILQSFLDDVSQSYPTEKLTLVYAINDVRFDNQAKRFDFSRGWPMHVRAYIGFADDPSQKITNAAHPLIHVDAKASAIYPFMASTAGVGSHVPAHSRALCSRNVEQSSQDCVTSYSYFLQLNWGAASLALNRELIAPEISMEPTEGARLMNSVTRGGPGWRLVVNLDKVNMQLSPFEYKRNNRGEVMQGEAQTIFAAVASAYILAPNDEVVWRGDANELVVPVDKSKLVADVVSFDWPSRLPLMDNGVARRVYYDFFLAKYHPDTLDQHMLEAMFSSRWAYEKSVSNPVGGRFFSQNARVPTWQEVQKSIPVFKNWLVERAATIPGDFKVRVPVRYANGFVRENTQCVKMQLSADSPQRTGNAGKAQVAGKIRQCQTSNNQAQEKFEQCETLRRDLDNAETALAQAQAQGCESSVEAAQSEVQTIDGTGSCDFGDVDLSQMQTVVQACLADRCGPTPTTMNGMAAYQECAQAVSNEMQEQMRAALGGGRPRDKSSAGPRVVNQCKPHELEIRNSKGGLKSFRCEKHTEPPVAMDCTVLGEVPQVSHMHIERLLFSENAYCAGDGTYARNNKASAALLPQMKPYTDTHLQIEIGMSEVRVPYDPPAGTPATGNAAWELDLTIDDVELSDKKLLMKFNATVTDSKVVPEK